MSTEEAIARLEEHTQYYVPVDDLEAFEMAVDSLRDQQTTVKLDRSRFGCEWCEFAKRTLPKDRRIAYCEKCGCPLTEDVWEGLERRINGGTTDLLE